MFGVNDLKSSIKITEISVECPVSDCKIIVPKQRGIFQCSKEFYCPKHSIYISPSTFEYKNYTENLLWKDETDLELLRKIAFVKRESRIARDNSEDALTWNVFRFLEKEKFVKLFIQFL